VSAYNVKVGDLVRFNERKRANTDKDSDYAKKHLRHIFEIGIVVSSDMVAGTFIAFPSGVRNCSKSNLELVGA
jgi:hypothetical protein